MTIHRSYPISDLINVDFSWNYGACNSLSNMVKDPYDAPDDLATYIYNNVDGGQLIRAKLSVSSLAVPSSHSITSVKWVFRCSAFVKIVEVTGKISGVYQTIPWTISKQVSGYIGSTWTTRTLTYTDFTGLPFSTWTSEVVNGITDIEFYGSTPYSWAVNSVKVTQMYLEIESEAPVGAINQMNLSRMRRT